MDKRRPQTPDLPIARAPQSSYFTGVLVRKKELKIVSNPSSPDSFLVAGLLARDLTEKRPRIVT